MKKVLLSEIIGSTLAISPRKGQKAYDFLSDFLQSDEESIEISFHGISDCSSAFCNSFIGKAFMNFDPQILENRVKFVDFDANSTWQHKIHNAILLGSDKNVRTSRQSSLNDLIFH